MAFAICAVAVGVPAQQMSDGSSAAELLKQLTSNEPVVRNDALEKLRSNPEALRDAKIKTALVNLLNQENHVKFSMDDEGYAEYVAWLAETTVKVVDWTDQRQVCILTDGVYLEDELADHAKASLPMSLEKIQQYSESLSWEHSCHDGARIGYGKKRTGFRNNTGNATSCSGCASGH
jgi:hypothetical protein